MDALFINPDSSVQDYQDLSKVFSAIEPPCNGLTYLDTFQATCPLSTIDLSITNGTEIPIEERSIEEVTGYRDFKWATKGISVRNPVFDVTPAD